MGIILTIAKQSMFPHPICLVHRTQETAIYDGNITHERKGHHTKYGSEIETCSPVALALKCAGVSPAHDNHLGKISLHCDTDHEENQEEARTGFHLKKALNDRTYSKWC